MGVSERVHLRRVSRATGNQPLQVAVIGILYQNQFNSDEFSLQCVNGYLSGRCFFVIVFGRRFVPKTLGHRENETSAK